MGSERNPPIAGPESKVGKNVNLNNKTKSRIDKIPAIKPIPKTIPSTENLKLTQKEKRKINHYLSSFHFSYPFAVFEKSQTSATHLETQQRRKRSLQLD